jgi:kinetochore protein NNF1
MLDTRLKNTQEDNKALMQRITDQRSEMESLVQGLEGVVADLEGSVEALTSQKEGRGVDVLNAEVWEMQAEIQASR